LPPTDYTKLAVFNVSSSSVGDLVSGTIGPVWLYVAVGALNFNTSAGSTINASGVITTGHTHTVLARVAGTVGRLYLDGKLKGTNESMTLDADKTTRIGGDSSTANFGGNMYLVIIYDRGLSDAEAVAMSANPYQIFEPV